jgi:site-specific recombinase XerD
LNQFAKGRENQTIETFTYVEIESWLSKYTCVYTKQTWLNRLSALFSFCYIRRKYISSNPCDQVERITIGRKFPKTLTVDQSRAALDFIKKDNLRFLRWFTLAHFCGTRPEETDKVEETMIEIKNQRVVMPPEIATPRQVPIPPVALEWLKCGGELPLPLDTRVKYIRRVRDFLGFKTWPQDILRHTAASMMLAKHQDAGKVATWLGNSAKVLTTTYIIIPEPERVEAFYNLYP